MKVAEKTFVLEPATGKFIESLTAKGGKPIYQMTPEDARNTLESIQSGPVKKSEAKIEDLRIPLYHGGDIKIRIIRPEKSTGVLPITIYCHGAGWVMGSDMTHDRLIRELANGANTAIILMCYSRSPEAHFPAAIEQAYAVTKYFAENGKKHNLDPSHIAIAGDSVGGNMAIVVTLLAKERGGPKIDFQVLFYPVTNANFNTPSYLKFAEGPWLTKPAMEWFWNAYEPDASKRSNYLLSPLNATLEQLKGLPPALVITDENDVLRDEGEAYAYKLMQAGVTVTAVRYLGTIHDFVMLHALADTPASKSAISLANSCLHKALYG